MVENAMVLSSHGLSDESLLKWFADHSHECAVCRAVPGMDDHTDSRLVELVLENDVEVAECRFASAFPEAAVRRANIDDYASGTTEGDADAEVFFDLKLGCYELGMAFRSGSGGGTGAKCWPGGILLAQWLMFSRGSCIGTQAPESAYDVNRNLRSKDVLEVGAGSAALPSMAALLCGARRVCASDMVSSVVDRMTQNLQRHAFAVETSALDWQTAAQLTWDFEDQFDVILFADCIYTERGAFFLADAISSLLRKPDGIIVGALPGSRAGIKTFEEDLRWRGFIATEVTLDFALLALASKPHREGVAAGVVVEEPLENYRIVVWHCKESNDS